MVRKGGENNICNYVAGKRGHEKSFDSQVVRKKG
jgi:hypothetical protein